MSLVSLSAGQRPRRLIGSEPAAGEASDLSPSGGSLSTFYGFGVVIRGGGLLKSGARVWRVI